MDTNWVGRLDASAGLIIIWWIVCPVIVRGISCSVGLNVAIGGENVHFFNLIVLLLFDFGVCGAFIFVLCRMSMIILGWISTGAYDFSYQFSMFLLFVFLTRIFSLFDCLFRTYCLGIDSFVVHGSELSWAFWFECFWFI